MQCPKCGSVNLEVVEVSGNQVTYRCRACNHRWTEIETTIERRDGYRAVIWEVR